MSNGSVCFGVTVRTVSSQCTMILIVEAKPRKCWIPEDSTSEGQHLESLPPSEEEGTGLIDLLRAIVTS